MDYCSSSIIFRYLIILPVARQKQLNGGRAPRCAQGGFRFNGPCGKPAIEPEMALGKPARAIDVQWVLKREGQRQNAANKKFRAAQK